MALKCGKLNIVHVVFCCLGLGCGITYSVLISNLLNFIFRRYGLGSNSVATGVTTIMWIIGFAYIVPGVVGIIAACLRKKAAYIVHVVLGFVAIGVLAYLFFRGLASSGVKGGGSCYVISSGACVCESSALQKLVDYFSCKEIEKLLRMGISVDAMFFGGGVVTFIAAVLSIVLSRQVEQSPAPQPATAVVGMVTTSHYGNGSQYQYPRHGTMYPYRPEASAYGTKNSSDSTFM